MFDACCRISVQIKNPIPSCLADVVLHGSVQVRRARCSSERCSHAHLLPNVREYLDKARAKKILADLDELAATERLVAFSRCSDEDHDDCQSAAASSDQ